MEVPDGPAESSSAEELFATFLYTDCTLLATLEQFSVLKKELGLEDVPHYQLFSKLKEKFTSWRITSFMEILQRRINNKEYASCVQKCRDCNIFVVGAGPCGLRMGIEAALCGANVVVAEKRSSFTRNNVLHLWPYLIHDLRNLGIKKIFGKFCAGSLDHISIRRLQLILVKISLVLGIKILVNTSFVEYLEPCKSTGWRISVKPSNLEVEMQDFHVLVGADGKRNSIPGFQRKEFRAKLAIGITANFVNKKSDEEAKIEEISGVAALFNQKFFADLKSETDIDLENIVYYKDDTHYFVMTAKKQCLLKKGVLKQDENDVIKLLSYQNVDKAQLLAFVNQAADFSAGLPHSQIAVNPDNGTEDVAIFDFTSMYSAEYAAKILERRGKRLIIGLVGDGLMEPFWPLGTGCARGFLSCMDLMWTIKQHQCGLDPVDLLSERMNLYQLLHQTSNENMHKKHSLYTMNPKTRYKIIPKYTDDVSHLFECDEKENKHHKITPEKTTSKKRLAGETTETVHKQWKKNTFARTRRPKNPSTGPVLRQKRSLSPEPNKREGNDQELLLTWCKDMLRPILPYLPVTDLDTCWRDGVLLCGLVHLCSPKHVDLAAVKSNTDTINVDLAITVIYNEFGIQTLTADDILPPSGPDLLAIITTIVELKKVYEGIQNGVQPCKPIKRKIREIATTLHETKSVPLKQALTPANTPAAPVTKKTRIYSEDLRSEKGPVSTHAPSPSAAAGPDPMEVEVTPPTAGSFKKRVHSQRKLRKKTEGKFIGQIDHVEGLTPASKTATPSKGSQKCHTCAQSVLVLRRVTVEGYVFHRKCFVCEDCQTTLKTSTYHLINSSDSTVPGRFYCQRHFSEIMNRSRDLKKSVENKGSAAVKLRKKEKKQQRPVSVSLDSMKMKNKAFRPSTPTVPEEEQVKPSCIPKSETPKSDVAPAKPSRPISKTPTDLPASANSRYKDTALEIHKDQQPRKPRVTSPKTLARVTVTEIMDKRGVARTRAPSPPRSGQVSKKQRSPGVEKKLVYHEDVPTESMPDNVLNYNKLPGVTSPLIDMLPTEDLPHSNITTRKKSKKAHKAPTPPTPSPVKPHITERPEQVGSATALVSKDKTAKEFSYSKKGSSSGDEKRAITTVAAGVKGRKLPQPAKQANETLLQVAKPPTASAARRRSHGRTSSMSTLDNYLPNTARQMQFKYAMNNPDTALPKESGEDQDRPMSIKDRIAMLSQNSDPTTAGSTTNLPVSASFSVGGRKKIEVGTDLRKNVLRDGTRISASRPGSVQTDSPGVFARTSPVPRRKRLRLKPTNKQNQRRLAQAQVIQRDRSLLEQKLHEFENTSSTVEQQLRTSGKDDKGLLSQFLELVNIKNELTRRENELHLCEKYLQLLDEQDQVEVELRYLLQTPDSRKTDTDKMEEEELILRKFDVVNRRDYLLTQLDDNKRREEEENEQINAMLSAKGITSDRYNYNTESFITIDSLLEGDEEKDDEVEDELQIFEQQTYQVKKREKKKRENGDDNVLSRILKGMSLFGN